MNKGLNLTSLNDKLSFLDAKKEQDFQQAFIAIDAFYTQNESNLSSAQKSKYLDLQEQVDDLVDLCGRLSNGTISQEKIDNGAGMMAEFALDVVKAGSEDILKMTTKPATVVDLLGGLFDNIIEDEEREDQELEDAIAQSDAEIDEMKEAFERFSEGYEQFLQGDKSSDLAKSMAPDWAKFEDISLKDAQVGLMVLEIAEEKEGAEFFEFVAKESQPAQAHTLRELANFAQNNPKPRQSSPKFKEWFDGINQLTDDLSARLQPKKFKM